MTPSRKRDLLPGMLDMLILKTLSVQPARDMVNAKRRSWLLGATMFVGFGMLALIVAAVGVYGVIAYDVVQRMHELSVRIALAGVVLGTTLALAASRWVQPLLFRQSATDPVILLGVGAGMSVVALLASASPALRATRADPVTALRED